MAKNLKLNIKNTQLAEVLKLNKLKTSPEPLKKKKEETPLPPPVEEKEVATPEPVVLKEDSKPIIQEPVIESVKKDTSKLDTRAPFSEVKKEEKLERRQDNTSFEAWQKKQQSLPSDRPFNKERPPYRPPFTRPVVSGEKRPLFTPRYEQQRPFLRDQPPQRPLNRPVIHPKLPPTSEEIASKRVPKAAPSVQDDKGGKKPADFKDYRDFKSQRKQDSHKAFDSRDKHGLRTSDEEEWRKKRINKGRGQQQEEVVIRPKELKVRIPITVKDLASEMKLKASQLISKLFMQGVVLTLNDILDDETTIQLLGNEFDCALTIDTREEERLRITDKTIKQEIQETDSSHLTIRPPVVAFMGHVDHGKTSLVDAIRKTNVAGGEAGSITQHIGAFRCHTPIGDITILDTPGHEAFSAMRSRGADVTDIVVLVVAGDEGIKAQTIEAIEQARAAEVPIMIAITKSDKPNFNAETIYRQLSDQNLLPEIWGGTTITVNCSVITNTGIKELLEMLALQAEIQELKANSHTRARGTVIESQMHKGLGAVATVLIQNGTLRLGDSLVFGEYWARIKTMHDESDKEIKEAKPSTPVKITGLSGVPNAGSEFIVVKNEREARELSEGRREGQKTTLLQQSKRAGLEGLLQQKIEQSEKKILNLVLRADVQGSLDALKNSLLKISSSKVEIHIIFLGVGEISESDIQLAAISKAIILGFHTEIESHAESLIKQTKVVVKLHDIIYHAVDDIKALMLTLLDKVPQENDIGSALVKAIFKASQLGVIAGCIVTDGLIKRNSHIRLLRDNKIVWKGSIASLKRTKEDVKEVSKGIECGILLQNFNDAKEGDVLQAYEITYLQQEL